MVLSVLFFCCWGQANNSYCIERIYAFLQHFLSVGISWEMMVVGIRGGGVVSWTVGNSVTPVVFPREDRDRIAGPERTGVRMGVNPRKTVRTPNKERDFSHQ